MKLTAPFDGNCRDFHPGFDDQKLILIEPCITRGERAERGDPKGVVAEAPFV